MAALEPMRAGRPCIVSDMVGAKSVVADVSRDLVCRPTVDGVAGALSDYLSLPLERRRDLCCRSREAVSGFCENDVVSDFVSKYRALCDELPA